MPSYSRFILANAVLAVLLLTGLVLRDSAVAQEKARTKAPQQPKAVTAETKPVAAATKPVSEKSADLTAIEKSADAFTEAFNKGDAKAIAALFTPEAEYVDGFGRVFHGRDEIETLFAEAFKDDSGMKIVIDMESVRLVSAGVLIEEGATRIESKDDAPLTQSRYIVLHARQPDGKWLMASCRTTRDVPITPHERLKALDWLVGKWVDESPESVVETTWRWSDDGNYLLGDFDIRIPSGVAMKGTQRIGWDAFRQQFRTWVFDSQGGFTEGIWTATEDGWIVKATGVSSDGDEASSTNVYTRAGNEAFFWASKDRVEGGEVLPDVEVKVVRAAPEPEAKAEAKAE
jgi:uncharacterized protein (TIGR02246 family)